MATRILFPYKKCQHNILTSRNYQNLTKPLPNQSPHTQQVPALHVLFLFIPRERSGSGKLKIKPLILKPLRCIKQNFFCWWLPAHINHCLSVQPNSKTTALHPCEPLPIPDIPSSTKFTSQQLPGNSRHFLIFSWEGCSKLK